VGSVNINKEVKHMAKVNILERIKPYKTVSIIGMDKNVGKTTVLNYILNEARGRFSLGLTSIGRDGEDKDRVTLTKKPKIYVERGTLIATAKQCLFNSDVTREIIETTGIHTPMGEVIIAKALSDGYVELGGPSINAYMQSICTQILEYGADLVLIDGALSRKTTASPAITEATILSTGASLGRDINKVVEMTSYSVKLLSIEQQIDNNILKLCKEDLGESRVGIIFKNESIEGLDVKTSLEASKEVVQRLQKDVSHVVIRGIVTDSILEDIMKSTDRYKGVTFLVEDGTKLFVKQETLYKFQGQGAVIKALEGINLKCVTCNPKAPYGYEFDKYKFLEELKKNISLPVYDVVGGGDY
jgi:hypothetical protein